VQNNNNVNSQRSSQMSKKPQPAPQHGSTSSPSQQQGQQTPSPQQQAGQQIIRDWASI
jgi:hypothetical protein